MTELTILGNKVEVSKKLETFPFDSWHRPTEVEFMTQEFTCNCPVTHQPDYYQLVIRYLPALACIETKSLKLYLLTFRTEEHFAEVLAHIVREDLCQVLPGAEESVEVGLTQQIRGGIVTTVRAHHPSSQK